MAVSGGKAPSSDEADFAHELDLARRRGSRTTKQLAHELTYSERTIRRYLRGDRLPDRQTVARWEEICGVPAGSLTAHHDKLSRRGTQADRTSAAEDDRSGAPGAAEQAHARTATIDGGNALGRSRGRALGASLAAVVTLGVLLTLAAMGVIFGGSDPVGRGADQGWDHKDPQESGCSRTPELLASVPMRAGRTRLGTLELKGSTSCQTAWGRVALLHRHAPPFTVTVQRPSDGKRDVYVYRKAHNIVFGNMLKHSTGCVFATATLGSDHATARTPCRR